MSARFPTDSDLAAADAARMTATLSYQSAREASEKADLEALRAAHVLERERQALNRANDFYLKTYEQHTKAQDLLSPLQSREKRIRKQFVTALRDEAKSFADEFTFQTAKGFVFIYDDPFRWCEKQSNPQEVRPGVFCVNLETKEIHRATGGDAISGASEWKLFEPAA